MNLVVNTFNSRNDSRLEYPLIVDTAKLQKNLAHWLESATPKDIKGVAELFLKDFAINNSSWLEEQIYSAEVLPPVLIEKIVIIWHE